MEYWKPVLKLYSFNSDLIIQEEFCFEYGDYFVSSEGRFKRGDTIVEVKPDDSGTYTVSLKGHRFKIHQIVLQTFMPEGICNGCSPDHIDRERRWDNSLNNLRWANRIMQVCNRENVQYKYKPVYCRETKATYPSCRDAEEKLNLTFNTVCRVARGERKSIHGYHFNFVETV